MYLTGAFEGPSNMYVPCRELSFFTDQTYKHINKATAAILGAMGNQECS